MTGFVIDASAAYEVLRRTDIGFQVIDLVDYTARMLAPQLIDIELVSTLKKELSLHGVTADEVFEFIEEFESWHIDLFPMPPNLVWPWVANLSAYDACYVVLAQDLEMPLITCDKKLANAPGVKGVVETVVF